MKKIFKFSAVVSLLVFAVVSCSKSEPEAINEASDQPATVEECVDVLTKALTREDLEDLALYIKHGEADHSFFLRVEKEGVNYVEGEVALVAGDKFKKVALDLSILGWVPVVGDIDVVRMAASLSHAGIYLRNQEKYAKWLEDANQYINVQVMSVYQVVLVPKIDERTNLLTTDVALYDGDGGYISITELIALL